MTLSLGERTKSSCLIHWEFLVLKDLDFALEERIIKSSCLVPWVLKVMVGHKSTPLAFSPNQFGKFIYQTQKNDLCALK
uniref:Uncharacterized protein n=1 Tax=Rhizophora mucronata TaxID=61149 RepID=A0A2P2QV85_RHIMU